MLILYIIAALIPNILGFPKRIPIGGLFDSDEMVQRAFELSVKAVNRNISVSEHAMGVLLKYKTEKINRNTFQVAKIACELVNSEVAGIYGFQDKWTAGHVQSMCDILDIPYITGRWDLKLKSGNLINLHPHPDTLSMVFQDLITAFKWKEFAIMYGNTDNLIRMNRLLQLPNMKNISVMLYHLSDGPDFRLIMQEIKLSGYKNIVIDCSYNILATVLEHALQVGILSEKYKVIVASLDLQTLDLEPYKYCGVNLTGLRLIDPESPFVRNILQSRSLNWNLTEVSHLRVEPALAYDAIQLFASGYARLRDSVNGNLKRLFCNRTETWGHGFSLINYMRSEQIQGLTGLIKFDTFGFRSEFQLDIVNLEKRGLRKVGTWKPKLGIQWKPGYMIPEMNKKKSLRDKHFTVLISLTHPYGMFKRSVSVMTGNERYEGFAIDIIREMSNILGFNYTFQVQLDNIYGSLDYNTGKWDGMLGEIIAGKADLAITDLTITSERQSAVDFTTPFMTLGISVLYQIPTKAPTSLFSFLLPFSKNIWMYLIVAYITVTTLLFVIGKICPVEWINPYPCIKEPKALRTPFTLADTPFFVLGSLLKSPTGFAPAGISTRTMATAGWFFCLIMGSTYTANLAAALSTKSIIWPFKVIDELAYQHKIKYGAKKEGTTLSFFKESSYEPYEIMYNYMMDHADEVLMTKNEDGVWKVQHENYAYIMESTSIEYIKQRQCNVTQIGGLLDSKGYGIAMKKDSPYRSELTGAVLKLQENGVMDELQIKWWKQERGGNVCEEKEKVKVEPLMLEDVGGVFLVMISGVMLSWLYTIWLFLWNIRSVAMENNVSYKKKFVEELRFLAKCSSRRIVERKGTSFKHLQRSSVDLNP